MAAVRLADQVGVAVDQAGQHGVPGQVDERRAFGRGVAGRDDAGDAVAVDDDGAAGQQFPGHHVEQQAGADHGARNICRSSSYRPVSRMAAVMASAARLSSAVSSRRSVLVARDVGGDTLIALGRPPSTDGTRMANELSPGSYSWLDSAMPSLLARSRAADSTRQLVGVCSVLAG